MMAEPDQGQHTHRHLCPCSDTECDIRVQLADVSARHTELKVADNGQVRVLGSRPTMRS